MLSLILGSFYSSEQTNNLFYTNHQKDAILSSLSLRSKRFQSILFFFCSCPSFLDEPREETLATQASPVLIKVGRNTTLQEILFATLLNEDLNIR